MELLLIQMKKFKRGVDLEKGQVFIYGYDLVEKFVIYLNGYIKLIIGYMNLNFLKEIQVEVINQEVCMYKMVIKVLEVGEIINGVSVDREENQN